MSFKDVALTPAFETVKHDLWLLRRISSFLDLHTKTIAVFVFIFCIIAVVCGLFLWADRIDLALFITPVGEWMWLYPVILLTPALLIVGGIAGIGISVYIWYSKKL